jgi:Tol biopolymer transport system component
MATLNTRHAVRTARRGMACAAIGLVLAVGPAPQAASAGAIERLAAEVRDKGWICYAARTERGDWDLWICRPDGSRRRNLTQTPDANEFSPQFSHDDRHLIYRRVPRAENIDGNRYGQQGELVLANANGTESRALGAPGDHTWASWSPDSRQVACLSIRGVEFFDLDSMKPVRRLDRKGLFQQLTWSPDGRWLVGVANSFGTGWSVARMDAASGDVSPVNRVDCCTPDWFPDSRQVIFSWRPPGQKGNDGQGWTQLWRAQADGASRQLVYGEDGRHVYGGHVSPDGRHVLFTGNLREDGDPGNAGAPMALMRLADAPIVGGSSPELRALHPDANDGPVLTLPVGWEPCWTFSDAPVTATASPSLALLDSPHPSPPTTAALAAELRTNGWLVFSAKIDRADWDLFRMRPDGSDRARFAGLPEFNEGGARFSPDGSRVLYYRLPKSDELQNNEYGTGELVVSRADGSQPVVLGRGYPWATWGPDSRQVACLAPNGIQIIDLETRAVVRQLPRRGIVSQLGWSPDGRQLIGTANGLGPFWTIACLDAATGTIRAISETERYNCTPDWVADSRRVVYARGIIPEQPGRAELWVATLDGQPPTALYAEESHHVYGACASPDMKYLLFTRSAADLTKVEQDDTRMAIIRWADTPIRGDDGESLRARFPQARTGPRLDLGPGWEPTWTQVDLAAQGAGPAHTGTPAAAAIPAAMPAATRP